MDVQRFGEHDKYMREAIMFLNERYGRDAVEAMTDVEIGYTYSKIYARESLWKKSNS